MCLGPGESKHSVAAARVLAVGVGGGGGGGRTYPPHRPAPDQPRQPGAGRRARGQLRLRHAHQRDQRDHQQVRKIRNIFMCVSIIFPKILQIFLLCLKIFLLLPARHSPRPSTWPSPAASTRTAELILQVCKHSEQ